MAVRVTAEEFTEKHARRLKASEPDIRAGINRVSVAPGVEAAKKQDKLRTRLLAKIDDGTWGERVKAVSLEEWKSKATTKGIPRIASGIDGAKDKVTKFAQQLLPAVATAQAEVKNMPDLTLEDMISRSSAFIRKMSQFKKK